MIRRNRTPSSRIGYGLYLDFRGLSTRKVAKALSFLHIVKRSHIAIWKWIQKYRPKRISSKREIEFLNSQLTRRQSRLVQITCGCGLLSSKKTSRFSPCPYPKKEGSLWQRFIEGFAKSHGKHPVSTDGGTWYPQACRFLKRQHHIHSPYEKSIIERTIQRIKDRAECFDDYFPCSRKKGCNFLHIRNWLGLFATMHSKEILNA